MASTNNLGVYQVDVGLELEVHECGTCGVMFGMSVGFVRNRRKDHQRWVCPNGHGWSFTAESEEEKLRRQLSSTKDTLAFVRADRDQTEARLRSTKGVVTKQKKKLARVAAGVCPCCNRTFQDLARHMENKHPNFTPENP